MNISTGELAVLHQFTNVAVEGLANRRYLEKANAADPGLDPVIAHPRHAEQIGCVVLGQTQCAPAPPQRGTDAGLGIVGQWHRLLLGTRAEQTGAIAAPRRAAFDR